MANLQQPNAQNISQAVRKIADDYQELATEVAQIQNMPAFNQGARIIQILQQLLDGQQQLRIQVGHLQNQVRELQNHQQCMPMMLYKASASDLAPLRYPAGIPIDNVPATCHELTNFTGPQLQVAAGVLGLPALPDNALIDQHTAQIAEYLGIPY